MAKGKKTGGRKAGTPNKATVHAREAMALLVENNIPRMQAWLDEIAEEKGAEAAWRCMQDVIEYHLPKRARVDSDGNTPNDLKALLEVVFRGTAG